jgi:hypothetical protein
VYLRLNVSPFWVALFSLAIAAFLIGFGGLIKDCGGRRKYPYKPKK